MRDSEVVAAIVSGEPTGLAEAYGRYAAPLYAYCRSQLGVPEDAAGAVLDTFVVASYRLRDLRDPERFRPWLYTVARNACHRRLNAGARRASLDEEVGAAADEPGAIGGDDAQRALARAAVAALSPDQRDVVELSLRHKLSGQDLADVLGVSRGRANALAARARRDLRRWLRTLVAARLGRADCQELDALLADWDGQLTDLLCKRVGRHTEHCAVCGERERADQAPEMLLNLLPTVGLPADLRRQVLDLGGDAVQAADLSPLLGHRPDPFGASGFPAALDRPRTIRVTGRSVRAAATGSAAVAVVAVIATVAFKSQSQHEAISPAAAATGPGSVAAASATASPGTRHGVSLGPGQSGGTAGITPGIGAAPVIGPTPTPGASSPGASPSPRRTTPAPTKTSPAPGKTSPAPGKTSPAPTPTTPVPTTTTPAPPPTTPAPPPTTPAPPPTTPAPPPTTPVPTPTTVSPTVTTTTTAASPTPTTSPSAVLDQLLALSGLR
jgi:RNA polymerase sigma factor (sigma-70 family)